MRTSMRNSETGSIENIEKGKKEAKWEGIKSLQDEQSFDEIRKVAKNNEECFAKEMHPFELRQH